jgi:N-acetylmuramic acid 6-phosphate etherase
LDLLPTLEMVRLIQAEDARVAGAVAAEAENIARAVDAVAERLGRGGRLFYVGAGSSGRIGVLDAAEIHPTFGVEPETVQAILAGGVEAVFAAVEGAEDDEQAGEAAGERCGPADALVGIAASGTTPYTVAAVRRASSLGAFTIGLTCAEGSPLALTCDLAIVTRTGPEVLLGSTRMKAGTAQKMVLNTLSTGVMVRLGRVYADLMIEMPPTNRKLRRRARLLVELGSGTDGETAAQALEESGGSIKEAIVIARKKVSAPEAAALLKRHGGRLREVLGE